MRKTGILAALGLVMAAALTACGGGDAFVTPGQTGGTTPATTVATVTVTTSSPSLASSNTSPVEIRAYVKNANNQFMSGIPVSIVSDSGSLGVSQGTTDATGVAIASLSTPGEPANRTITVTATAQGISGKVTVAVTGTTVSIQGADALITGAASPYTVTVTDSSKTPIAGAAIAITAQPSATLSAASVTTDSTGVGNFTLTPTSGGTVTLTATGVGTKATKAVSVSADSFSFSTPAADASFALSTPVTLSVRWLTNNVAVANGQQVSFSATRGTLSSPTAVTSGGNASVTISSATAGESIITATNSSGGATQLRIVFVASTANAIDVQASPFTIGINQSSTITAVVRDAANNLVAGKVVTFNNNTDPTFGSLTQSTATTDSQGRATTVYRSSSTTSANNGVIITATVTNATGSPASVTGQVKLTVAGSPLFIKFGTGNTIQQVNNDSQYLLSYTVSVTDANGAGVANVPVSVAVLPWNYYKGVRSWTGTVWTTIYSATCVNEDRRTGNPQYDFNGILDPGEDENGPNPFANNQLTLEPGNVATITPGSGTTDANGFLNVSIYYPQDQAYYVSVVLRANTQVQGTEFLSTSLPFLLPGASSDFNQQTIAPPGPNSPYGVDGTCTDHL